MNTSNYKLVSIKSADRIDIIAHRELGRASTYSKLLKDNPSLNVWNLKAGTRIRINRA